MSLLEPIEQNARVPYRLQKDVHIAIDQLVIMKSKQIENGVHETNLSHHLAKYLEAQIATNYYDVDIEYNRHGEKLKSFYDAELDEEVEFKPDIVIHKAKSQTRNRLVIEMKTKWKQAVDPDDEKKLKAITRLRGEFGYQYGLFLAFEPSGLGFKAHLLWYWNGKRI